MTFDAFLTFEGGQLRSLAAKYRGLAGEARAFGALRTAEAFEGHAAGLEGDAAEAGLPPSGGPGLEGLEEPGVLAHRMSPRDVHAMAAEDARRLLLLLSERAAGVRGEGAAQAGLRLHAALSRLVGARLARRRAARAEASSERVVFADLASFERFWAATRARGDLKADDRLEVLLDLAKRAEDHGVQQRALRLAEEELASLKAGTGE